MPETIERTFNPSDLPKWSQRYPSVVERCRVDLAYRCNVYAARTSQMRYVLRREAERLTQQQQEESRA